MTRIVWSPNRCGTSRRSAHTSQKTRHATPTSRSVGSSPPSNALRPFQNLDGWCRSGISMSFERLSCAGFELYTGMAPRPSRSRRSSEERRSVPTNSELLRHGAAALQNLQAVPKQGAQGAPIDHRAGQPTPVFRDRLSLALIAPGLSRRRPRVRVASTPPTPSTHARSLCGLAALGHAADVHRFTFAHAQKLFRE